MDIQKFYVRFIFDNNSSATFNYDPKNIIGYLNSYQSAHIKKVIISPNTKYIAISQDRHLKVIMMNNKTTPYVIGSSNYNTGITKIIVTPLVEKEFFGNMTLSSKPQNIFTIIIFILLIFLILRLILRLI